MKNVHVTKDRKTGKWNVKEEKKEKPLKQAKTQEKAIEEAKEEIKKSGGGELIIHGKDGKIIDKNTIPKGNDPCPPEDR